MAASTLTGHPYPMDRSRTPAPARGTSAKASFFTQTPLLEHLAPEVLSRIALRASQASFDRREVLWSQGDEVTALYWVRSGVIREMLPVGAGREYVLGFYGRLDVLGEACALRALMGAGEARRTTTAVAHEESTVYALPVREIEALAAEEPQLALRLAALVAQRRQRVEERLATASFRSAHARIAAALMDLGQGFGVRDSRGIIVNLRLTHRDLAGLAGASRETASLALLEWRRDGLLLVESKRVVLLDVERLSSVARDGEPPKAIPWAAEER
jgi:CRP/FNR family cyclic AMP-dependent transcriptional regulator